MVAFSRPTLRHCPRWLHGFLEEVLAPLVEHRLVGRHDERAPPGERLVHCAEELEQQHARRGGDCLA